MASATNYDDFQRAKVLIADALRERGWRIFGYHEDQSDWMTDYYDPANWSGIATKNGYIVNVDCGIWESGKEDYSQRRNRVNSGKSLSERDIRIISALREVRQDRGASAEEERSALEKIAIIEGKCEEKQVSETEKVYFPEFQENPGRCSWHVEKDGKIIIKGTGIAKFGDLRHASRNMKPDDFRYERTCKLWKQFDALINKIDTAAGATVGNDVYDYETVTEVKYKHKNVAVPKESGRMEDGAAFILNEYLGCGYDRGNVYRLLHKEDTGSWYAVRLNNALTQERTGKSRGNRFILDVDWLDRKLKGKMISWCVIVDEMTPYEVQRVVKRKKKAS